MSLSESARSLIHTLTLAIGHGTDAQATARTFLVTLVKHCPLDGAALWWRDALAPPETLADLVLLATEPAQLDTAVRLPASHAFWELIRKGNPVFSGAPSALESGSACAPKFSSCTLLPVAGSGILALYAPGTPHPESAFCEHLPALAERLGQALHTAMLCTRLQCVEQQLQEQNRKLAEHKRISDLYATHAANARAQLHALFRSLPDLVWLKDPDGVYLACNQRFELFFGACEQDIVGKTDYDFVDREQADFFREYDRKVMARREPSVNEEWITFANDGHRECLETTKTPLYDDAGHLIGVLGIGHDITERKQMEDALRQAETGSHDLASLLRRLCDNVPDMIWAKDLEKRYLFANKAICDHLLNAQDIHEPIGKTDLFFARRERSAHPENPHWHTFGELCQDSDALTLQFGKPSVFEEYGNVRGASTFFEVHKSPFYNERGEVIGTVGSARDITERKRIEAELEQHRRHLAELVEQRTAALLQTEARASQILQSAASGLYGTDNRGRITFINPAACHILGYTEQQLLGRSAHAMFHHHHPNGTPYPEEECSIRHQVLEQGQEVRSDDEAYWHADGHPIPISYAVHPMIHNGVITGTVVCFMDASEQRAATEAREQAIAAAEQLARVKSEFLANMSHEIRTPLNGILGFAEIGLRSYANPEQAKNAFEKILFSSKRLLVVVNDVLDFSKIEAGKLCIVERETNLAEVIERSVDLVRERAAQKRLSLFVTQDPDLPATCLSDPARLGQILLNLLTNAVKFTEQGEVRLHVEKIAGDIVFTLTDTGIGIEPSALDLLFNPFQQADGSLTRRFDGSGLGLAICKRLLELMSGSIHAESVPKRGSTFVFCIPYIESPTRPESPQPTPLPAQQPPAQKSLCGLRILVAEDDATSQLVLEHNLSEDGASVTMVSNGQDAVRRIENDGPAAYDVILMDIQMPYMDGFEATHHIRRLAPKLPIIGQTAHAFREERERCLAAGMVDHIAKPIDPNQLNLLLQQFLTEVPQHAPTGDN